jgi:hypothetical protein
MHLTVAMHGIRFPLRMPILKPLQDEKGSGLFDLFGPVKHDTKSAAMAVSCGGPLVRAVPAAIPVVDKTSWLDSLGSWDDVNDQTVVKKDRQRN